MKILIIGRTGSGKDTVARTLFDHFGLRQLVSNTTRPKRTPTENTHIFVSKEEAAMLTDRVAETKIGEYEYFATREDFEACDIYVIDPLGMNDLLSKTPDEEYLVCYVWANQDVRLKRARLRGDDHALEVKRFAAREESEAKQFDAFEKDWFSLSNDELTTKTDLSKMKKRYPNICSFCFIKNNSKNMKKLEKVACVMHNVLYIQEELPEFKNTEIKTMSFIN